MIIGQLFHASVSLHQRPGSYFLLCDRNKRKVNRKYLQSSRMGFQTLSLSTLEDSPRKQKGLKRQSGLPHTQLMLVTHFSGPQHITVTRNSSITPRLFAEHVKNYRSRHILLFVPKSPPCGTVISGMF